MTVKKIDLLKYKAQWTEKMYQIMDEQSKKVTKQIKEIPMILFIGYFIQLSLHDWETIIPDKFSFYF